MFQQNQVLESDKNLKIKKFGIFPIKLKGSPGSQTRNVAFAALTLQLT